MVVVVGAVGDGGRGEDCTPEIEFLSQNNGLNQTLHGHRLFDVTCLMPASFYLLFEMLRRITDSENMWVLTLSQNYIFFSSLRRGVQTMISGG